MKRAAVLGRVRLSRLWHTWHRWHPWRLCAALVAGLAATPVLADPMRPLGAATPSAGAAPVASAGLLPMDAQATDGATTRVRKLLAIRQEISGERAALWGDRWLRAGDRYTAPEGETVVLAIGSNHIELEQGKVKSTQYLLVPLLPPQWPLMQATGAVTNAGANTSTSTGKSASTSTDTNASSGASANASASASTHTSTSPKKTPPRPATATATPPAANALRTERP